jgi:hypothetical protein
VSRFTVNGAVYESEYLLQFEQVGTEAVRVTARTSSGLEVRDPQNHCEHCGRLDWVVAVARSWQEVLDRGWATRVGAPSTTSADDYVADDYDEEMETP